MLRTKLNLWFCSPLRGSQALLCATLALAVPTAVRAAINGVVSGCEFTPYLPFVFVCAMVLRWWQAALVALASVFILGGLFEGLPNRQAILPCFETSAGLFLAVSAGLIGFATALRRMITGLQTPSESAGGVIFSLEKGEVWASWYGHDYPLRLGSRRTVARMMDDFLKQEDLAKRLDANGGDRADR